jgi:hypothetical protein
MDRNIVCLLECNWFGRNKTMILNIGTNRNTNSAIITKPHNSLKVIFVLLKKYGPMSG